MIESTRIDRWIYATLSSDATVVASVGTRIYRDVPPQGAAYPLIVYQEQPFVDDLVGLGGIRILTSALYLIKGIAKGESFIALEPVMDRVDTLIHAKAGSTSDATILSCVRERPYSITYEDMGVKYKQLGGFYRIQVQPS